MKLSIVVIALTVACLSLKASAGEVIVNSATKIGPNELRDIYIGEKVSADGVNLKPSDNEAIQDKFISSVLKLDSRKYQAIWIKKAFRDGLTEPTMKKNDAEVIDFVKRTPGAVGYIEGAAPAGVVSILKF